MARKPNSISRKPSPILENLRKNHVKINSLVLICIGFIGSWKIGAYADSPADAYNTKINFGKLFGIDTFLTGYTKDLDTFIASYGYSLSILTLGPIWVVAKLIDPAIGLQNEYSIFFRNLISYSVGLIGIAALYKWGCIVLRTNLRSLPFFTPIFAPVLFGNFFMNSKDVPLFTGFAAIIYLFAALFDSDKRITISRRSLFAWIVVFIVFTIGVRPISMIWVLPLLFTFLCLVAMKERFYLSTLIQGIFFSTIYIVATNYFLLNSPIYWITNLFDTGENFPWTGAVQSWGNLYRSPDIPRSYFLEILTSQIPLIVFFVLAASVKFRDKAPLKPRNRTPISVRVSILSLIILVLQTLIMKPVIYDNARQLLFAWIFIIIILLWHASKSYSRIMKSKILMISTLALLAISFVDQVKSFPYNYTYRNEIARTLPASSFETDYWGISGKELTKWVVLDSRQSNNETATFSYIFQQSYEPFFKDSSLTPVSISDLNAKYYSQIWRPGLLPDYSAQCPVAYSVTRTLLFGKTEVLGYVRKC